jgi:hypothetical protein
MSFSINDSQRNNKRHYAECRYLFNVMLNVVMLSVVALLIYDVEVLLLLLYNKTLLKIFCSKKHSSLSLKSGNLRCKGFIGLDRVERGSFCCVERRENGQNIRL